jgi:hypothetical protein
VGSVDVHRLKRSKVPHGLKLKDKFSQLKIKNAILKAIEIQITPVVNSGNHYNLRIIISQITLKRGAYFELLWTSNYYYK